MRRGAVRAAQPPLAPGVVRVQLETMLPHVRAFDRDPQERRGAESALLVDPSSFLLPPPDVSVCWVPPGAETGLHAPFAVLRVEPIVVTFLHARRVHCVHTPQPPPRQSAW